MMKKYNYYIMFFLLMFFGHIQAQIYPNYSQTIPVTSLNYTGQNGQGGGTITINNNILTINILGYWNQPDNLNINLNRAVATLTVSPSLPDIELGPVLSTSGGSIGSYRAKIENNKLVFYINNSGITHQTGCRLDFSINLNCLNIITYYADNDLDGLGDPLDFITPCTKPEGNYVLDNTDNCPTLPGTSSDCTTLEANLQNQNFIKKIAYKIPTAASIVDPTIDQADQNITYYDGLGRPVQQNAFQSSASGKNIVTHMEYDAFGRQTKEYLPFASNQTDLSYINPVVLVQDLITQNKTKYGNVNNNPFSEKELEASPLNRILQQGAPGNDWKLSNTHTIKYDYQTNIEKEVKFFRANTTWSETQGLYDIELANCGGTGFYVFDKLYKNITYDENLTVDENSTISNMETYGSTVEFKNKEGQIVLKRTYDAGIKHDTYYVYDDYGNLTYVIPPIASDVIGAETSIEANINSAVVVTPGNNLDLRATNSIKLTTGFKAQAGSTFSAAIVPAGGNSPLNGSCHQYLDDLCYQYKYDNRNRLVEKKLPGKQWEFIVYDKLDRVVATGPALSPFNDTPVDVVGWLVTKYDALNRPVYTGWEQSAAVSSVDRISKQYTLNSATALNESKQYSSSIDGISVYYSNDVTPTSFKLLTVNYYDNYSFPGVSGFPLTIETQPVRGTGDLKSLKGLSTGSWTRIPTSSTAILAEVSTIFYDRRARPIRTHNSNYLGGYTYTDSKLDFPGKPEYTITHHKRDLESAELKTKEVFTYSPQGRLLSQTHQINDGSIELIASNTYDDLGQLIAKEVGGNTQKIDYTYNIRGWLTGINNTGALQKGTDPKDLFAFAINYNTVTAGISGVKALYNGNISETLWATNSDNGTVRIYGYKYDNLNRLSEGIYKRGSVLNTYNESVDYDKNGNIMHLSRYASLDDNSRTQIDSLTYDYKSYMSNQLMKVSDIIANNPNFKDEFKDSSANTEDDYSYDANGNMTKDNNKNITDITYNQLNLPTKITFASTGNIVYIYNATGQKVQKVVNRTGLAPETTDYLGGYQYQGVNGMAPVLKFFPTAEGYVELSGSSYKYVYQYKDHLGNVRLSYDKNLVIQEENNYYPFGLKQTGYNTVSVASDYKYKYNGKELQDDNIGGVQLNLYDYGARNYDPALGRWMNIDPLAEISRRFSPYTYANNNPVYFIDPDGMSTEDWKKANGIKDSDVVKVYQADNSESSNAGGGNDDSPSDDITVGSDGRATKVVRNGQPNRFFDESGNQLSFNDAGGMDKSMLSGKFNEKDKIYETIWDLWQRVSDAGTTGDYLSLALKSTFGGSWDFPYALKHEFGISDVEMNKAGYFGGSRTYFRFGLSNTLYNIYDAGQFIWGKAGQVSGFNLESLLNGVSTYEKFTGNLGGDSSADTRALISGYNFNLSFQK